ncbi:CoA transferase [Tepidiforma sp.]|uniref:CaiB/BaiF CoA transferase family protein n=1 Tax=Tepidiforma sp. TaxID=2682230 RepID=UPI0021DF2914|nr:CoA transferase [Tepidiforma sp.]MCX7618025.1 CoA transferase [Tepidiforma sp.]GIW16887.1 MAG: CoA transferase [Tepidiforma sp.]
MPGALEGVRVLDCTQIIAGPLAASLLSEMGADVIKVEPLEGEPWRLQAEIIPKESKNFLVQNRGKRGLALNFKDPRVAPIRDRLIARADVLITNYRPGVPEALGIDYESARRVNPAIIYAENTAFGKEGPDAMRRGYDIVAQAMSGLSTSNPNLQNGLPMPVAFAPADVVTGFALAWAITAALYHRQRTGEGQAINSSLLLSALALQAGSREIVAIDEPVRYEKLAHLAEARARGATMEEIIRERRRFAPELAGNIYYRPYKTKDSYLVVGCLGPGPRARFREALGITDPRYEPGFDPARLAEVGAELVRLCEAKFLERTNDEWLAHLEQYDIACGPVRFVEELFDDPQVLANGYILDYEHALLGPMRGPAPVVQMSATPTRIQRASPALGEHTADVLREAGFSDADIERFRADGLVA